MPLSILFDLDDTLLQTNIDVFLPAYFQALGNSLPHVGSHKEIAQQILTAVHQMEANRDPGRMLDDVFSENFYPPLGTTEAACLPFLKQFYREEFSKLRKETHPQPAASPLIHWCQQQGFQIVIATNPLFPETASLQRTAWAGLEPQDFTFISTYDHFHFTKPNLTYYAECLGRLGWPEGPAVMVGDSLTLDIYPMEQMGFSTYWVTRENQPGETRASGSLEGVQPWLAEIMTKDIAGLADIPEVNQAILRSTPAVIDSWLHIFPDINFHQRPTPGKVSLNGAVWQLAEMEQEFFLPLWRQLRINPQTPLVTPNTNRWTEEPHTHQRNPHEGLAQFLETRLESLDLIAELAQTSHLYSTDQIPGVSQEHFATLISHSAANDRLQLRLCKQFLDLYKIY